MIVPDSSPISASRYETKFQRDNHVHRPATQLGFVNIATESKYDSSWK